MKYQDYLNRLEELLKIPSLSAEPEHEADMKKAADWLADELNYLGFKANVLPTSAHGVVYAENLEAGAEKPTVLIYGHYDVQSPDPLSEWTTPPFEPTIRANNLYCRGVADDKGQLYTWVAAVSELKKAHQKLPVNIKFLIEGAEEIGSVGLSDFVATNKSLLACDVVVLSDNHCLSETLPLITIGLRGLVYLELKVKTLGHDVHSGIYGGNVINPANALSHLIAKLKDEKGKILIPGFYDDLRKIDPEEKEMIDGYPLTETAIKEETGAISVTGENDYSIPARAGIRPTLDVNGLWSGFQGEGAKTVIPAFAGAKISMRTVPYQSSQDIVRKFKNYLEQITPEGVEVEVKELHHAEPLILDPKSKYFKVAREAYHKIFGQYPLYELSGGSIGVTVDFHQILGIDVVMMGYGLPDDGLHAPNEKMSLSMFEKGIETSIEFLKNLA